MTAIVGILNKRGIAIAADSAVTFTNAIQEVTIQNKNEKVISIKDKVINSGDKMLRLKDKQPVAVMIVGNSLLTKLPWDVIIRWYRKQNDSRSEVFCYGKIRKSSSKGKSPDTDIGGDTADTFGTGVFSYQNELRYSYIPA